MQIPQKLAIWRRFQDRVFRQNFRFAHIYTLSTVQQITINSGRLSLNNKISFIIDSFERQRRHEFYEEISLSDDIFATREVHHLEME